jgi:hypothetical protein
LSSTFLNFHNLFPKNILRIEIKNPNSQAT